MSTNYDVKGKVFFITGGANGLGKCYTEALLERSSKVFFVDIEEQTGDSVYREFSSRFGAENVRFSRLDVSDRNQFEKVFQEAVDTFGHVDVMVNNAGIVNEFNAKRTMDVNFLGTVNGTEIAFDHLRADEGGKGGRIINISSFAGLTDIFFFPLYCASKHAVRTYTSSMAQQPNLDKLGVELAAFCPVAANTRMQNFNPTNMPLCGFIPSREERKPSEMPLSSVTEAFMKLVSLKIMNGALLCLERTGVSFVKMNFTKFGEFAQLMEVLKIPDFEFDV